MKKVLSFVFAFSAISLLWQCGKSSDDPQPQTQNPTPTNNVTIASFSPVSGFIGQIVTITGTNFSTTPANNIAKFNGTTATISAATATQLTVTIPTGATTGKITVEVAGKIATSTNDFTIPQPRNYTAVSTLAGSNQTNSGYLDGTGANAIFSTPRGFAQDSNGDIYVADFGNSIIRKITPQGVVTTFAGASGQTGTTDGTGTNARFANPTSITMSAGDFYIVDASNHRIRKMTPAGVVTTLAGSTQGYNDAIGTSAQFNRPRDIVADNQGNLFVTELTNPRIRKIVISTGAVSTFAGNGATMHIDNTGTNAGFPSLEGICIDTQNNLFVVSGERCIRKITPNAVVSTFAGNGNAVMDFINGEAGVARFTGCRSITIDSAGFLYVLQYSSVRRVSPQGDVTDFAGVNASTYATSGNLSGNTNGALTTSRFNIPNVIICGQNGILYVSEAHKIRKIE